NCATLRWALGSGHRVRRAKTAMAWDIFAGVGPSEVRGPFGSLLGRQFRPPRVLAHAEWVKGTILHKAARDLSVAAAGTVHALRAYRLQNGRGLDAERLQLVLGFHRLFLCVRGMDLWCQLEEPRRPLEPTSFFRAG